MKNLLFYVLLFGVTQMTYSQNEAMNWYFGFKSGLNFSSGVPVALTDGELSTIEGCSTISDFNGDLLFYTDGITVWNRTHNPMPNGTGLKGHPSSTQSGLIVPHPGDPNQYYVFTVAEGGGSDGIRYNIIDMTLDGGLGNIVVKNQLLETPVTERLTAVKHSNGTDIWLLAHKYDGDEFLAYRVSPTGLETTPVITSIGFSYISDSGQSGTRGYMKVSPDGSKLAIASIDNFELFQFDSTTGILSNGIDLRNFLQNFDLNYGNKPYGIEFSSDSSKLYVTSSNIRTYSDRYYAIHQFDVSNYNAASILGTGSLISPKQLIEIGGIQLAVDGKIYVTQYDQGYLGVINNPNVLGLGSYYVENAVFLNGGLSSLGLPPFIQSYFVVGLNANNFCLGDSTEFSINANEPILTINWDFGDGSTSTLENPAHSFASSGTYTVSVTATTASETKTESKDITIYETPVANLVADFEVCSVNPGRQFDLTTKDTEVLGAQLAADHTITYYPSLTDAQNGTNFLPNVFTNSSATETIFARIANRGNPSCYGATSFDLVVKSAPKVIQVSDWTICDSDTDGLYNFDLSQKNIEILNGQNASIFSVQYFESQADADGNTNAISINYTNTSAQQNIYFRIHNTSHPECYETASFQIEVITGVTANPPTDLSFCDDNNDGRAVFDLFQTETEIIGTQNGASLLVSYHESQTDADNNVNPLNATNYQSDSYQKTIYARVSNSSNSACFDTTAFQLNIFDTPVLPNASDWSVCDDNNDGQFQFDLSEKSTEIFGTVTGVSVSYYQSQQNADLGQNSISGLFQNGSNPQTIFYRLENTNNANCFNVGTFDLQVFDTPIAGQPTDMIACDVNETGSTTFNLSLKDAEVLNGLNANSYTVTYFSNSVDANEVQNPLYRNGYINSSSHETVFARLENNAYNGCFDVTSFELIVNSLPYLNLEATYVICPDSPELVIDGGDFETWTWSKEDGALVSSIRNFDVPDLGSYFLTVSQILNGLTCEKIVKFEVVSSGAPESFTTTTDGISDLVTLSIDATGIGEFEYSIDGENFQNSNQFKVFPGTYTVYVRDHFLCRTLSKDIIALGYQKFFTPNGDGYNEYWNIIGANLYPESRLFIYDRYGKLINQVNPNEPGWDGTFNGKKLPSSDYWFRYVYDQGKVFSGHFSLKR